MKMQKISLPEKLKSKFLRVKWHLWRGNSDTAVIRLDQLQDSITAIKEINKIKKFKVYIENLNFPYFRQAANFIMRFSYKALLFFCRFVSFLQTRSLLYRSISSFLA
ncbi:MAG: hypothetical protein ACI8TE_000933 [Francisella sp.]|jgi:hypothetical protein